MISEKTGVNQIVGLKHQTKAKVMIVRGHFSDLKCMKTNKQKPARGLVIRRETNFLHGHISMGQEGMVLN